MEDLRIIQNNNYDEVILNIFMFFKSVDLLSSYDRESRGNVIEHAFVF